MLKVILDNDPEQRPIFTQKITQLKKSVKSIVVLTEDVKNKLKI